MYILFDIGATNTRVAAAKTLGRLDEFVMFRTPKNFHAGMRAVITAGKALSKHARIKGIAGGAPGPVDVSRGTLAKAPNLGAWIHKPIVKTLERTFHAPAYLQNDTAMVGLGEAVFGAGKGKAIVAYLTISTGVNGVRIVDGKIDRNAFGFEIGFQIVSPPQTKISLRTSKAFLGNHISGNSLTERYGKSPKLITNKRIWTEVETYAAYGAYNTLLYWSPHILVMGGSMMKSPGIDLQHVKQELAKIMKIFPKTPPIVKAKLGDIGGLLGALAFLKTVKR